MWNQIVPPLFRRGAWTAASRRLLLILVGLGLMAGLAPGASADPTPVTIANQNMEGTLKIKSGDIIAIGYVFRVQKPHPNVWLRVSGVVVTLKARCEGDPFNRIRNITFFMDETSFYALSVAKGDERWTPTRDTNVAAGFQHSLRAPANLCGPAAMIVDQTTQGVDFNASFEASQPGLTLETMFHYRVPAAKGYPNIDCSDAGQNRSPGIPACLAKWSATRTLTPGFFDPAQGQIHANINGAVFVDTNGNGLRDAGEAGLPGVLIEVVDVTTSEVVNAQLTWDLPTSPDHHGRFTLTVPGPGTYLVRQPQQPAGYTSTTANQATLAAPDGAGVSYDFGEQPTP